jgi:hypothetical protein
VMCMSLMLITYHFGIVTNPEFDFARSLLPQTC